VAVARPRCLYCGAAISAEAVAAAEASSRQVAQPAATEAPEERVLLVLEIEGQPADVVARGLGISAYDAGSLVRRGGFHFHGALRPGQAAHEKEVLASAGLPVWLIPEAEARQAATPLLVRGGTLNGDQLALKTDGGAVDVGASDLLLVVRGPIVREYQRRPERSKVETATLEAGYRFHLHRHTAVAPLEVDPTEFAFGAGPTQPSSLLQLTEWVETVSRSAAQDDLFRRHAPALAPSLSDAGLSALSGAPRKKEEARVVLDNLAQFRAYSGWRAVAERKRR
jgi:hypothetical protein